MNIAVFRSAFVRLAVVSAFALCGVLSSGSDVRAADSLKLAVGIPGNWDSGVPEIGKRAGIFQKHGLDLEILYTNGGGETLQAVISGSVDIGVAVGTSAMLGAFEKGAPVRVLAGGTTGASDLYWYVPADSPIKTIQDAAGKTVAFSTTGSSTHLTVQAILKHFNVPGKITQTGASAGTFTQVMSGQVDVGWASPPFGLQALDEGKIRIIARGSDVPASRDQTVRVHIVNANVLAARKEVIARFVAAYRESWAFLYDDPQGVKVFTTYSPIPEKLAAEIRDVFLPKQAMNPDVVSGLDAVMADGVAFKFMRAPLTDAQLTEAIVVKDWKR